MVRYKSYELFDLAVCLDTVAIVRSSILLEVYRVDEMIYHSPTQGEYIVHSASTAPSAELDYGSGIQLTLSPSEPSQASVF